MSDMIKQTGVIGSVNKFVKREITGENKEGEKEGTWSNSTVDYVTKGGITGGLVGAGLGAARHLIEGSGKDVEIVNKVPIMKNEEIGRIPSNHVAANPDTGDPKFIDSHGKPVGSTGVAVFGNVPEKNLLGGFKMDEKKEIIHVGGSSLIANIIGGAVVGTACGVVAGVAMKILNSIIHPGHSQTPWSGTQPPAWSKAAPPSWQNPNSPQDWTRSAPADWSNTHNRAPYNDVHNRSHSNYGDAHSNYSDVHNRSHSNYSDVHNQSHSNYSNTHSQSHSNYSNSHSNSWDRHVSY